MHGVHSARGMQDKNINGESPGVSTIHRGSRTEPHFGGTTAHSAARHLSANHPVFHAGRFYSNGFWRRIAARLFSALDVVSHRPVCVCLPVWESAVLQLSGLGRMNAPSSSTCRGNRRSRCVTILRLTFPGPQELLASPAPRRRTCELRAEEAHAASNRTPRSLPARTHLPTAAEGRFQLRTHNQHTLPSVLSTPDWSRPRHKT